MVSGVHSGVATARHWLVSVAEVATETELDDGHVADMSELLVSPDKQLSTEGQTLHNFRYLHFIK
jgi:hypothetical protein